MAKKIKFAFVENNYDYHSLIATRDIYRVYVPYKAIAFKFYDEVDGREFNESEAYVIGRFFSLDNLQKMAHFNDELVDIIKRVNAKNGDGAIKCRNGIWVVHTNQKWVDLP